MKQFFYQGKVTWAQLDPNQHMRHSAYADFAAQARVALFDKLGINLALFKEKMIGPILLREELIYLREVHFNDLLSVSCEMVKCKNDVSRWTIRHEIFRKDSIKAAIVTVDGAWIDLKTRKMTKPMEDISDLLLKIPRSNDFLIE